MVGLITFLVTAAAVGGLVDRLTRQGVQTARAKAEAEDLARLAADSMTAPGQLTEAIGSIRAVFDLDAVALLRRDGAGWQVDAAAGRTRLENPDQADYSLELPDGRVLALTGARLTSQDAALLRVFLGELRCRREHALLDALPTSRHPGDRQPRALAREKDQPMTRYMTRDRAAVIAAVAAPLAAAAILLPWRASWADTNVALLLVVVVVAVAATGNRAAGALAAVGAAAWFDFFFTAPYERFAIRTSQDVTTFVLLLVVGLTVSQLAARARRLKVITITDARYLAQIHESAVLAQSDSAQAVVDHVREQLVGVLALRGCRFEYGMLIGHPPRLEQDGTIMTGHGHVDVDLAGMPGEEVELRTFGGGQYCGRFMLTPEPGSKPSLQARLVAVTLADLAGRALGAAAPSR